MASDLKTLKKSDGTVDKSAFDALKGRVSTLESKIGRMQQNDDKPARREFQGRCNICNEWGHRGFECPNKESGGSSSKDTEKKKKDQKKEEEDE